MVNRNHLFNSSNYSLSSLFRYLFSFLIRYLFVLHFKNIRFFDFSVGSLSGSVASSSTSRHGSVRASRVSAWQGPSCLTALYQMLIAPFEDHLPTSCRKENSTST